jgi:cold shock CspA family protein
MGRILAAVILGSLAIAPIQGRASEFRAPAMADSGLADGSALPPVPEKKSTVIGGAINGVDPVRDQFMLKPFGQRPMKILFDERTQIFRDGKKIPLNDLRGDEHASVQTILDGTNVFAVSIHMLSQLPEGEAQGQVMSYDSRSGVLVLGIVLSKSTIKLYVPANTPIVREGEARFTSGQSGTTDLVRGSLVSVKFESDKAGRAVASQIAVMATPGSEFVFSGNLTSLDMHSGIMVLSNPNDGKTYQVHFDAGRFPVSSTLHPGDAVSVNADFDGKGYVASAISVR